jgi:hypothetical protein
MNDAWREMLFRRIRFLMLATALAVPAWSSCQAAGSFQTKPAFSDAVTFGDDESLPPTVNWLDPSANAFVGGCGRGRITDPQTHGCRGPADLRGVAR